MHLAQLLLPLYDNDRRLFPREDFEKIRLELANQFGGVTSFLRSPAEGIWHSTEQHVHHDEVVMFEVMVDSLDKAWWADYRRTLETHFRQDEVIVRIIAIERL